MKHNGTHPLTKGLLSLIVMVQTYQDFIISRSGFQEDHGGKKIDWHAEVREFFFGLDDTHLRKYGLSRNEMSLDAVLNYRITDEIMHTDFKVLPKKFTFAV